MFRTILSHTLISLFFSVIFIPTSIAAEKQRFKPFVLASSTADTKFADAVIETRAKLLASGFEVLGEYAPYQDSFVKNARVIIVTNPDLLSIAKASLNGGFAAPWRVSITDTGEQIQVAYANPLYLKHAYRLKGDLEKVATDFKNALGAQATFGSKKGLTARKLAKYHYTVGMEHFDDVYVLATHESYAQAIDTLEKNLADNEHGLGKVYRLDLDDEVSVFGVSRKGSGKAKYMDEHFIMQTVDFKEHKGTAYLPYEIMVKGNQVIALHMRFRMAVHYPDLKMMGKHSFMKIRPSPKKIKAVFVEVAR